MRHHVAGDADHFHICILGVNADKNAPSFIGSPLSTSVTSGSIQVFLGKSPIFGGCTLGPRPPKIQQKKDIFAHRLF